MVLLCKTDECKAAWQEVYPPRGDEFSVLQKQIRQHKNGGNRELARKVAEQTFNAEYRFTQLSTWFYLVRTY